MILGLTIINIKFLVLQKAVTSGDGLEYYCGFKSVPPKFIPWSSNPLVTLNVTLFGNKMIVNMIIKMNSCWNRVGPHSNVTDAVIKKGTLDTDMHIGRGQVEVEDRGQDDALQARNVIDCQQITRRWPRSMGQILHTTLRRKWLCWYLDLWLLASNTVRQYSFYCLRRSVCGTLLHQTYQTNTSSLLFELRCTLIT